MNHLQQIQKWMKLNEIDLFLINRTDEFLSEYIAPYAERLKWISNFSGSAGRTFVLQKEALIFIDGRYTLQAYQQVDSQYFSIENILDFWKYLEKNIETNSIIGIDP
jgi:Xaa-Pro aminopeptidase